MCPLYGVFIYYPLNILAMGHPTNPLRACFVFSLPITVPNATKSSDYQIQLLERVIYFIILYLPILFPKSPLLPMGGSPTALQNLWGRDYL